MKQYVVGFLFSNDHSEVVLIRKNRPAWQEGLLNGVGGKIEPGESPKEAMSREFIEETGLLVTPDEWEPVCAITWPHDLDRTNDTDEPVVHFFRYTWPFNATDPYVNSLTDEQVVIINTITIGLRDDLIPNLKWLIPLAAYKADRYAPFKLMATVAETL